MYPLEPNCSNVFKSGENQPTSQQITGAWIALIHALEKSKEPAT